MAELIFRGVKNPANCSECFFWSICPCLADFDDYSAILDAVHDGNLVRHEECPVSPLPEGHGRLIDADAFKAMCLSATKEAKPDFIRNEDWLKSCAITMSFCRDIDEQPTIVQAEGGTDDERVM